MKKVFKLILITIIVVVSIFGCSIKTDADIQYKKARAFVAKLEVGDILYTRDLEPLRYVRILATEKVSVYEVHTRPWMHYKITVDNVTKVITVIEVHY